MIGFVGLCFHIFLNINDNSRIKSKREDTITSRRDVVAIISSVSRMLPSKIKLLVVSELIPYPLVCECGEVEELVLDVVGVVIDERGGFVWELWKEAPSRGGSNSDISAKIQKKQ